MNVNPTPPNEPAGPFQCHPHYGDSVRESLTQLLSQTPQGLREATAGLDDVQLDTKYKNWTIRQITHHLADSHLHSLVRFKWALSEDNPLIKAYEEADWVELEDCRSGDIEPPLQMLSGLHAKWVQLLGTMTPEQFARTFRHPQSGETVDLWTALNYYAWHGRHHTGQIRWLCRQHGWNEG